MDAATLPDLDQLDSQALKSLILSQREQLASRDLEIEHLKLLIAKLRRQQFGRSSEKREHQIEQLELRLEECTASVARSLAARSAEVPSEARSLSGLWRPAEASWRRCLGNPGVRSGQSQSHSVHTSQAGLCVLRSHRAGCSAESTDRAKHCWSWASGACPDIEIL